MMGIIVLVKTQQVNISSKTIYSDLNKLKKARQNTWVMFDIPSDNEPWVASQTIIATMYSHYETMNDGTSLGISSITQTSDVPHEFQKSEFG